jgi:O-glycosyl hydrolase
MLTGAAPRRRPHAARIVASGLAVGVLAALVVVFLAASDSPDAGQNPQDRHAIDSATAPAHGFTAGAASGAARIAVTRQRQQRIEGWGMTVLEGGKLDPIVAGNGLSRRELRRLDRLIFDRARINLVRVFGPNQRGGDPDVEEWSRSEPQLEFMRRVRERGVRFMFTGGGAPPSMRHGQDPNGALAHGHEAGYAGFLADNLAVAQRAGARFAWAAAANEPDIYGASWVAMTPDQAALVYAELARLIHSRGLRTQIALGDNQGWTRTEQYVRQQWEDPGVRRRAAVVSTHDYSGRDPGVMQRVASFARQRDLSLWMTEWTGGCPGGGCPDTPDISFALRWAQQISYDLSVGDVQAWFLLQAVAPSTHGADSGIAVRRYGSRQRPYYLTKRYWVLRQFTSVAPPGSHSFDVQTDSAELGAVAFRRRGRTGLVVTNPTSGRREARVDLGSSSGVLRVHRTSQDENFRNVDRLRYRGQDFSYEFPPQCVTTFQLKAG